MMALMCDTETMIHSRRGRMTGPDRRISLSSIAIRSRVCSSLRDARLKVVWIYSPFSDTLKTSSSLADLPRGLRLIARVSKGMFACVCLLSILLAEILEV